MRRRFALLCLALLLPASVAGAALATGSAAQDGDYACAGRIADPAGGTTLVSVQGARYTGDGSHKTPARLVAYGPEGQVKWVYHSGEQDGVVWSYDVDPLANGNVFVTATRPGKTLVFELNPANGSKVWSEVLPYTDTHDADLVDRHRIAIANMRNYNETTERNDDRLVIYNRTSDEVEQEWLFREHYDRSVGGDYVEDWTHVNDVDKVGEDTYLLSPRNFDQVVLVNVSSGDIELRLGRDGKYGVLKKQHNPDFLRAEDGTATVLVADSENERVVEYRKGALGWKRTWNVGDASTLNWPRDADRLRNGNTLIGDSRNNRVIEVTPTGEVVWEAYAPWLVYDVERIPGDGSQGPTIADMGESGSYQLTNATPPETAALERCDAVISDHTGGFEAFDAATPSTPDDGSGTGTGEDGATESSHDDPGPGVDVSLPLSVVAVGAVLAAVVVGLAAARRR